VLIFLAQQKSWYAKAMAPHCACCCYGVHAVDHLQVTTGRFCVAQVIPLLKEQGYRVIALDFIGSGRSDKLIEVRWLAMGDGWLTGSRTCTQH
jgi:pimeloyl-ACP methyl ester carboxylesterase